MKAKRIKPAESVNPLHDPMAAKPRKKGEKYTEPETFAACSRRVVDDPNCWRLCPDLDPPLVPEDDECRKKRLSRSETAHDAKKFLRDC